MLKKYEERECEQVRKSEKIKRVTMCEPVWNNVKKVRATVNKSNKSVNEFEQVWNSVTRVRKCEKVIQMMETYENVCKKRDHVWKRLKKHNEKVRPRYQTCEDVTNKNS